MKALIVFAHPERASFSGALADRAVATLRAAGHDVVLSDLYRQDFRAVGDRHDFAHEAESPFSYQAEQRRAFRESSYASDVAAEQEKVAWADLILLNFPLWWFGPPAILKGWIDRVMSVGFAYDGDRRFEDGPLRGRSGLVTITTGSPAERFAAGGGRAYAPIDETLKPLQHGLFPYVGMQALAPFVAFAAARVTDDDRSRYLDAYERHLTAVLAELDGSAGRDSSVLASGGLSVPIDSTTSRAQNRNIQR